MSDKCSDHLVYYQPLQASKNRAQYQTPGSAETEQAVPLRRLRFGDEKFDEACSGFSSMRLSVSDIL